MTVLEQLRYGLGDSPSRVIATNRQLTPMDLRRVVEARGNVVQTPPAMPGPLEIWPLISHHGFNRSSLFGLGERGDIQQRVLTLLLAHDGLVAADPLIDVERLWLDGGVDVDRSLAALQTVVGQVAKVEPLIEKKHLRFEAARPTFTNQSRKSILDLFGISPDLLVFANFEQAFQDAKWLRGENETEYIKEARELFRLFNMEAPRLDSAESVREAVTELASAMIHISWQLAVCAQDPNCDLTLTGKFEHRLFDELADRATNNFDVTEANRKRGKTRHVKRLAMGRLPNLDAEGLSVPDAIALRRDNAFENFRTKLRGAMNYLPEPITNDPMPYEAVRIFEEQMLEAAAKLRESVSASSFRGIVKRGSVPAAVGCFSSAAFALPTGITWSALAAAGTFAGVTVAKYCLGRTSREGTNVAVRYFASLGGEKQLAAEID